LRARLSADQVDRRDGHHDREREPHQELVPAVMTKALRVQGRERREDVDAEVGRVVEPLRAEVVGVVMLITILILTRR
jgi:hypothetical protein